MKICYLPSEYSQQRQREKKRWIYPVLLAMQAEYYRKLHNDVMWDAACDDADRYISVPENIDFLKLPAPDRLWTRAKDPKYQSNGNFKYHPATYIQVANGCWWGRCSFCVENKNAWQVRDVKDVIEELKTIQSQGFKEVFDDSGTFPVGKWLNDFISGIDQHNINLRFGCNMRLCDAPFREMRRVGFRMVLFGVESANQKTLDRIRKGTKVEDIRHIKSAAHAGIDAHIAVMFGFPWENDEESLKTLKLVHDLLRTGVVKTAQASFYTPPGGGGNEAHRKYVKRIYDVAWSPEFWIHKIKGIKTGDDLKYLFRQIKEGLKRG